MGSQPDSTELPANASEAPAAAAGGIFTALAVCVVLIAAVVIVFGQSVDFEFVNFDDNILVYDVPMVKRGLTLEGAEWAMKHGDPIMWFPLTWLSYMLDTEIFGTAPRGYHLTNVILHALTSAILFLVLRRMTADLWPSALVAFLFAVHPLQAESVAWVSERKGVLNGLFFVLLLGAYSEYARRPFSIARYFLVAGLFALGLMAKPSTVTTPLLLLLLDYWPLRRWRPGQPEDPSQGRPSLKWLAIEKVPLLLLSVAASIATVLSQGGNVKSLRSVPFSMRCANALISYGAYLRQFVWPSGLSVPYPYSEKMPAEELAISVMVLATVSVAALMLWRVAPAVLIGWLWYLVLLVPVIGLVKIGYHSHADRYTYLPQIGLALALVWGLKFGLAQLGLPGVMRYVLCGAACASILGVFMFCAWRQTSHWRNSETLWVHTLECNPRNGIAENNFGTLLLGRGDVVEAIKHYRLAVDVMPYYADGRNNLGLALMERGQIEEAVAQFRQAQRFDPDNKKIKNSLALALTKQGDTAAAVVEYRKLLAANPDSVETIKYLAKALAESGQAGEAVDLYRRALTIEPDQAETYNDLGTALARQGKPSDAVAALRRALDLKPDLADAHLNLGSVFADQQKDAEAIAEFRQALELNPHKAEAHGNLGSALARSGKIDEAMSHFEKAVELNPKYLDAHVNFAMALTEKKRFDDARLHYQAAIELAKARKQTELAKNLEERMNKPR